ncbi:peptide ligase PGM1-related protein [Streptomyces subrutilus]|uniref:preATP grasp domain-containing protein n=1 Tax=Streptomyces subrutilus TaxID=36818 RepID=UPI0033E4B84F
MTRQEVPLLIFANINNDTMMDRSMTELAQRAARQTPRKVWLARPGDVVVTPQPVSTELFGHACTVLGMRPSQISLVSPGSYSGRPLAESVRADGPWALLRRLVGERPRARLLPYAVDHPTMDCAEALGVPIEPYGADGISPSAWEAIERLNGKDGFRAVAREIGVPVPDGQVCADRRRLRRAVGELAGSPLVVKPLRAASGHGLLFLSRTGTPRARARLDAYLDAYLDEHRGQPAGWVVEQCIAPAHDVSVQVEVEREGPRAVYDGRMRIEDGSFHGYLSPLDAPAAVRAELADIGLRFGGYLADRGYLGPLSVDARLTGSGRLYAIETNVRRTGTTTMHQLVQRLTRHAAPPARTWLADSRAGAFRGPFGEALSRLRALGLAYDPGLGEGALLTNDTVRADGRWNYLVMGAGRERVEELAGGVRTALRLR